MQTPNTLSRRELLGKVAVFGGAAFACRLGGVHAAAGYSPVLSVQAYIWIQHFEKWKKTLGEGVEEMLATFQRAGYRNVDLNDSFFAAPLRVKTLGLLKKNGLAMPTFYANSVMHEARMAEQSIKTILELAEATKPAGVRGIVTNPSPKPKQGRKSDDELAIQARYLNQLGGELKKRGVRLMVHHHTPELVENAREWRYQLANTDPQLVGCCVDLHWAYRGGQEPLAFLREVGPRLESLHLRNSQGGVWMEDFNDGDVNYRVVADYLKEIAYQGYLVVELAYEDRTKVTRSLEEDLRLSRLYTEKTFGLHQG
ncbi:MAG: sugar phosphate isomerase/epimerase [Terriglobia bacterium]|jgi:inosose dehydratase